MDSASITVIIISIVANVALVTEYSKCPFVFPYKIIKIDITSKRNTDVLDYIDKYLLQYSLKEINRTLKNLDSWKSKCVDRVNASIFRRHRCRQYLRCCDEEHLFTFRLYKTRTKYTQVNYVKHPHKIEQVVMEYVTNYDFLNDRFEKLKEIGFQSTLSDFQEKNQRKLMTKTLRTKIAKRDNYTCQKCGKYMPDGVGLHIDHIVPISKGGKSIPSNLQVLCSKCNGNKSDKVVSNISDTKSKTKKTNTR